ncbi:hypothetical protein RB653_008348 [Dictyostelium firmibasis]|uniref:CMP/dCMP-type deaminase domain-containing protein n=1 Tax=Dictyostelium firmibasis TaxID=79012 RepID=A0AAN7YZP5_9MYCE
MHKYLFLFFVALCLISKVLSCDNGMNPYYSTPKQVPVPLSNVTGDELAYHQKYMQAVIDFAKAQQPKALFAASIVHKNGTQIVIGMNMGRAMNDGTQHAEIVVIQKANALYGINNFTDYTLYTTGESCLMCQGAILYSGFSKVVYGTSIKTLYCDKCMSQVPIDSTFLTAYGYGLADGWVRPTIIGGVLSNITDNEVFRNYCPNGTVSIFKIHPLCVVPTNSTNSTSSSDSAASSLTFSVFTLLVFISYLFI